MNSPTPPPFPLSFKRIESRFHVLLTPFVRCASRCFEVITRFSPFLLLFSKIVPPSESRRGKTRRETQVFSKKGREIADTGVITNKFSTRNEARKRERVNPKAQRKGLGKRTRGDRLKIRDVFSISSRDIRNCCLCFSSRRRLRLSFELFDLPRHPSLSLSILILEKGLGVARIFGDPLLVFLDLSTRVNFQSDDDDSRGDKDRYIFVTFVT